MKTYTDFFNETLDDDFDEIVIEINSKEHDLSLFIATESWKPTNYNGFSMRLDPPNPENNIQRHIHITKNKHINSKNKQVSWNQDGTRHDKHSFDRNFEGMKKAKKIASSVLKIDMVALESYNNIDSNQQLQPIEDKFIFEYYRDRTIYFKLK